MGKRLKRLKCASILKKTAHYRAFFCITGEKLYGKEANAEADGVLVHAGTWGKHIGKLVCTVEPEIGQSYFKSKAAIKVRKTEIVMHFYFMRVKFLLGPGGDAIAGGNTCAIYQPFFFT